MVEPGQDRERVRNVKNIRLAPRPAAIRVQVYGAPLINEAPTDRMRFFHAYMLANPSVCAAYKEWAERIMTRTRRRFRRKGWSSADISGPLAPARGSAG